MKKQTLLLLLFINLLAGYSQVVPKNVAFTVDNNGLVTITYDLPESMADPVFVKATLQKAGDPAFSFVVKNANGSIGKGNFSGAGQKIYWDYKKDTDLDPNATYFFKVESKIITATTADDNSIKITKKMPSGQTVTFLCPIDSGLIKVIEADENVLPGTSEYNKFRKGDILYFQLGNIWHNDDKKFRTYYDYYTADIEVLKNRYILNHYLENSQKYLLICSRQGNLHLYYSNIYIKSLSKTDLSAGFLVINNNLYYQFIDFPYLIDVFHTKYNSYAIYSSCKEQIEYYNEWATFFDKIHTIPEFTSNNKKNYMKVIDFSAINNLQISLPKNANIFPPECN